MSAFPIILGSQSPRRKEIMNFFSLPFTQVSPSFDESSVPFNGDPHLYVEQLSNGKACSLVPHYPHAVVITADTIVYKNGKVYGKPKDEQQLYQFLKEFSGDWHTVFTSITVSKKGQFYQQTEDTRVLFNTLSDSQLKRYSKSLPWKDKAGGYMAQLAGSLVVNRIDGCYYNVIGLPINSLNELLKKVDIDLWSYLKNEANHKE